MIIRSRNKAVLRRSASRLARLTFNGIQAKARFCLGMPQFARAEPRAVAASLSTSRQTIHWIVWLGRVPLKRLACVSGSCFATHSRSRSLSRAFLGQFNANNIKAFQLKEIISNSNIPFLVDIQEFDNLPKSFQEEILKNYIVIYDRQP